MELTDQEILLKELERIVEEHGGQRAVERKAKKSTGHLSRILSGETALCIPSLVEVLDSVGIRFPDFVQSAYEPDLLQKLASGKDPDPDLTALLQNLGTEARAVDVTEVDTENDDEAGAQRLLAAAERLDNERYNDPYGAAIQTRPLVDQVTELTVNPIRRATIAGKIAGVLGSCYRTGAQLHEAEWALQEAFRLLKSVDAQELMGEVLQRVGTVLLDRLRYTAALEVVGEAESIYAKLGNARRVARCWVDLGMTLYLDDQLSAAVSAFETALRMLPVDEARNRSASLTGLAIICHRRDDLEGAERHLQETEDCGFQSTYTRAMLLRLRGDLAKSSRHMDAAARYYSAARDQLVAVHPIEAALAGIDAADALLHLGRIAEAISTAKELGRVVEPLGKIDTVAQTAVFEILLTIRRGEKITRQFLIGIRRVITRSVATHSD